MNIEDLEILKTAEKLSDSLWRKVSTWDAFAKGAAGLQLIRSVDSIGANIAEAFGRFHFGDKLRFYYYARGSIFETKFWINRALSRELISKDDGQDYLANLTLLAKQLNSLVATTKAQSAKAQNRTLKEQSAEYLVGSDVELFDSRDLEELNLFEPGDY